MDIYKKVDTYYRSTTKYKYLPLPSQHQAAPG